MVAKATGQWTLGLVDKLVLGEHECDLQVSVQPVRQLIISVTQNLFLQNSEVQIQVLALGLDRQPFPDDQYQFMDIVVTDTKNKLAFA